MSAFFVIVIFAVLTTIIFSQSIHENTFVRKNIDRLKAKYNAEFGFQCMFYEAINGGSNWYTHEVDTVDADGDSDTTELNRNLTPPVIFSVSGCNINADGNYNCSEGGFLGKLYYDPIDIGQIIILSRGTSGQETYLLAAKVSVQSLYEYFWFTPVDMSLGWTTYQADGGKMHSNGNIIFNSRADIQDVSEISTPNYFLYATRGFVPSDANGLPINSAFESNGSPVQLPNGKTWDNVFYYLRDPWQTPNSSDIGAYPYYHNLDGYVYGDNIGLKMRSGESYVDCTDFNSCIPADDFGLNFPTPSDSSVYTGDAISKIKPYGSDSPIQIPNRFDTSYPWDMYPYTRDGVVVDGQGPFYYPNPKNRDEGKANVKFMYTAYQADDWKTWRTNNGLEGVMNEATTDGDHIEALKINSQTYLSQAQESGIYIGQDDGELCGQPKAYIRLNGNEVICEGQTKKGIPNGEFKYNNKLIARKTTFTDVNSTQPKTVVRLFIDEMQNQDAVPINGIIYANSNVALENAETLPDIGLTTVSSENIYLKGNYNTDEANWQPSAVIAAKYVYTLSHDFNYPSTLPDTYHNPNYPYKPDNNYDDEGHDWYADHQSNMAHLVDENTTYYVSIVGYKAYPPKVLERWCEAGACKTRTVVGAFVNLEDDNFEWNGYPDEAWPTFDLDKQRCSSEGFNPGRNCSQYPGWAWDMTSFAPTNNANNIFKFETRYTPTNLPPGELSGYSANAMLEITDNDFNFTHHYAPFN